MRVIRKLKALWRDEKGMHSIEFPLVFFFMFMFVMFAFQVAFAMFELISVEKAAHAAARIAAVRDPVHTSVPSTNAAVSPDTLGDWCGVGANCTNPGGPWVCSLDSTDTGCDSSRMQVIYTDMMRYGIRVAPDDMTISYTYGWLGYAGGPFAPIVEVTIESRPFLFSFVPLIGGDLVRRPVTATAVGEDLATNYTGFASSTSSTSTSTSTSTTTSSTSGGDDTSTSSGG